MAERKAVLVRLDPALHDSLQRWAADEMRSVNAQIEIALRDQLRRAGRLPRPERLTCAPATATPATATPATTTSAAPTSATPTSAAPTSAAGPAGADDSQPQEQP